MNGEEVITQAADPRVLDAPADTSVEAAGPEAPRRDVPEVAAGDAPADAADPSHPAPKAPVDDAPADAADPGPPAPKAPVDDAPADAEGSDVMVTGGLAGDAGDVVPDAPDDSGAGADDDADAEDSEANGDSDSDDVRRELVRQFEAWLDRMDQGEPPPEGLPEELLADALEAPEPHDPVGSDLYSVFAGLTKLGGEVGLQGRAFRQLTDALAPSAQVPGRIDRLEAAQTAVARELARRAEPDKSALPTSEDVLAVLFDLYDRLDRGLRNFDATYNAVRSRAPSGGWLRRLFGGKGQTDDLAAPASALREGYRLTLSRLEAALLQWGIQRTGEVGEPFDPRRMAVVEVGSAPGAPEGSVLEVYRSGYVLSGHVLATARVKVAKAGPAR